MSKVNILCAYGSSCRDKSGCNYLHLDPESPNYRNEVKYALKYEVTDCRKGSKCPDKQSCNYTHYDSFGEVYLRMPIIPPNFKKESEKKKCRFDDNCTNKICPFTHSSTTDGKSPALYKKM